MPRKKTIDQTASVDVTSTPKTLTVPVLALRDVVVFPGMTTPLFMGREKSIHAAEQAVRLKEPLLLLTQKDPKNDDPKADDLFAVGCLANVAQLLRLPDGTVKGLTEGYARARVIAINIVDDIMMATVEVIDSVLPEHDMSIEFEAARRVIVEQFESYAQNNKKLPKGATSTLADVKDPSAFVDAVAGLLQCRAEQKVALLSEARVDKRLEILSSILSAELDIQEVEKRIHTRVKTQMEKNQRDYYLNEQIKAIQKELGDNEDSEFIEYEDKIKKAGMSAEANTKAMEELRKLRQMPPMSAEATVVRSYLDTLIELPWQKKSRVSKDINRAARILDEDHWGLEKVKERILEYLAVQKRVDKLKSPILCLVGAPGVGKTSLGRSIARATNREYVRMALGGVHDESEIRGHRRTYIGSMPGKILQNLTKAGVRNPLFLLDEVDKISQDYRGDPAAALLEVLDPEQNSTFQDNYADLEFDLSDVMFVATSNSYNIPPALLDRMEVIHLSGYTEDEKIHIAQRHLIPKQIKANGVKNAEISITVEAIRDVIRYYTREAGVRSLEREISKIIRKIVRKLVTVSKDEKPTLPIVVTPENLTEFIGVRRETYGMAGKEPQIGLVNGLAWTEVGGDLLPVEGVVFPGKGSVQRTGSLGDVIKESVEIARSAVQARAESFGIDPAVFAKTDWHIHFPEGATPKDGPSAGGAIATTIVSALTRIPVRADLAMTGEITLRGEILAIGGLKEKLLAALRGGIKTVIIPQSNVKDLAEIPDNVKQGMEIVPVRWLDEIIKVALVKMPEPLDKSAVADEVHQAEPARINRVSGISH